MSLHALQALFWQAVRSERAPRALEDAFVSRGALSASRRMQIYRSAYWARHEKCLRETYPRVLERLGAAAFRRIVSSYIEQNPSRAPSIEWAGHGFAAHLAQCGESELPALAALEWARVEVAMAPDERERFRPELLAHADAAERALRMARCVRLCRMPGDAKPSWLAVHRDVRGVHERALDAGEGRALERALRGEALAAVCAALGDESRAVSVMRAWIARGWLIGMEDSHEQA